MKKNKQSGVYNIVLSGLLLLFVAVLLIHAVFLVRTKLLQNAQQLGDSLVKSYAIEEEIHLQALSQDALLATDYLEDILSRGGKSDEVRGWLVRYFHKLTELMDPGVVDPYAVVDGQIVAANPWEGDRTYAYQDTSWYQDAIAAKGEVVSSGMYVDAITNSKVITFSCALENGKDVFAMDFYIENSNFHKSATTLPETSSYYLCDQNGMLLYASTAWEVDQDTLQTYARFLVDGSKDGSLVGYDKIFQDKDGVKRSAFFYQMDNGWTAIVTVPVNSILMGDSSVTIYVMAAVSSVLFLTLAVLLIRDGMRRHEMRKADETIHILGDSFYAIFRVNFIEDRYEKIKCHPDLEEELPVHGEYGRLLNAIKSRVQPDTSRTFERNFSLEDIRQRVQNKVLDYGGDFLRRFGDTYHWVNIRTLYDSKVAPDEVILCFRDVDTEKRQELQQTIILKEALAETKKSTQAKADFFSRMSHDMRTPLNAILGCCALAEQTKDSDKVWDYIRKIRFSGTQLLELINDILEMSRIENGKDQLHQNQFDLGELVEQTGGSFRVQTQMEGKTLEVCQEIENSVVIGDKKKITQIINNLLSNAIKYSNPGATVRLELRQFKINKYSKYQIVVEDTGIGMSQEFLEHLFDPYSRETTFTAHTREGTGLGMPIVKSFVQQMNGEISVTSELGIGSRVTVTIPLEAVEPETSEPSPEAAPQKSEPKQQTFDWDGRTALLAEDNDLNREIATELLTMLGVNVIPAVDGEEAVKAFSESPVNSIDVILMDMQMPKMDGCEAASVIRGLDREDAARVPIIAVTANAFAEDIDRTTKAGMDDHVSKPIDMRVLTNVMEKLISKRLAKRENVSEQTGESL